jgi:hypothetical protein
MRDNNNPALLPDDTHSTRIKNSVGHDPLWHVISQAKVWSDYKSESAELMNPCLGF